MIILNVNSDNIDNSIDFMKNELLRMDKAEEAVMKGRQNIINMLIITTSAVFTIISVSVKIFETKTEFLTIGLLLSFTWGGVVLIFMYLRFLNNVAELSIIRAKKALIIIFFKEKLVICTF